MSKLEDVFSSDWDDVKRHFNNLSLPKITPFKKWFKGSKVVSETDEPLVVFHATRHDFSVNAFNPFSHFGSSEAAHNRLETLMNVDKYSSNSLGIEREINYRVYPVFLNIKNPLRVKDFLHDNRDKFLSEFRRLYKEEGHSELKNCVKFLDEFDQKKFWSDFLPGDDIDKEGRRDRELINGLIHHLKRAGYDGLVYENSAENAGSDSYITFSRHQVRSIYRKDTALEAHAKYLSEGNVKSYPERKRKRSPSARGRRL